MTEKKIEKAVAQILGEQSESDQWDAWREEFGVVDVDEDSIVRSKNGKTVYEFAGEEVSSEYLGQVSFEGMTGDMKAFLIKGGSIQGLVLADWGMGVEFVPKISSKEQAMSVIRSTPYFWKIH